MTRDTTPDEVTKKGPQTFLALRVWRLDPVSLTLLSVNAGTTTRAPSWITAAMANPEGGWPHAEPLRAECTGGTHDPGEIPPVEECRCGIYATSELDVIASYLNASAPVLGVVELGGKVIPAAQGYRAQYARVAAILLIDPMFTVPHDMLNRVASAYNVPALVPHSTDPEDYRDRLGGQTLADEVERFLREHDGLNGPDGDAE